MDLPTSRPALALGSASFTCRLEAWTSASQPLGQHTNYRTARALKPKTLGQGSASTGSDTTLSLAPLTNMLTLVLGHLENLSQIAQGL